MAGIDDPYFTLATKPDDGRRPAPDRPRRRRLLFRAIIAVAFGVLGLVVLFLGFVAYVAIQFQIDTAPKTRDVAARDAVDAVANVLVVCELFGPIPMPDPAHTRRRTVLSDRIRSGRGFTESGGLNGDGIDWYEVDLSPDLAAELRANLERSALVKPAHYFPFPNQFDPAWWPKAWPEGSTCREYRLIYLILPPTGTRLWVQVWRT